MFLCLQMQRKNKMWRSLLGRRVCLWLLEILYLFILAKETF